VLIPEAATATHLYRIAQEAVSNALKHGQAKRIIVRLARTEAGTILEILDDGVGVPDPLPPQRGMGLRIMAHRATMIGGTLTVRRGPAGGTVVTCTVP
jgi:signal transduction histidine kinase